LFRNVLITGICKLIVDMVSTGSLHTPIKRFGSHVSEPLISYAAGSCGLAV
jgi:hypothetical protein